MNSKRKTYGVPGMMEYIANIQCGKAKVKIPFTGGSLSGYGVVPAEYTTENPFIQTVIENSTFFKNGKIILMRETDGTGKYKETTTDEHADAGTHLGGASATASAVIDSPLNPDNKTTSEEDGKTVVEVSDIDDARDYLSEEFDVPRSSLRSNISVYRCAEEHNIVFKGIE